MPLYVEGWKRTCSLLGTASRRHSGWVRGCRVVAIDFEKAFDSVDLLCRQGMALIRALMYYKCDPRMLD